MIDQPGLYAELRRLAGKYLASERSDHTLQPTAVVNEAYLRLHRKADFADRAHFLAVAARTMRRVLVDHARARNAEKRGQSPERIELTSDLADPNACRVELLTLDRALEKLTAEDPEVASVVDLRFFGGLTIEEAALVLECSPRKISDLWEYAKAWLRKELELGG